MFAFYFGRPGSGKSLVQAKILRNLVRRARYIKKKYKLERHIWYNFDVSCDFFEKNKDILHRFFDPMDLTTLRDIDIVWDEMSTELPADGWINCHPEIRRMFAQHRKRGIEIYGSTQDYKMVDINARRMVHHVFQVFKMCGNRDPSSTMPPIRFFWGLIAIWELDKSAIEDDADKKRLFVLPSFCWITKKLCMTYDTRCDIAKAPPTPFRHIVKKCNECGFEKCIHV